MALLRFILFSRLFVKSVYKGYESLSFLELRIGDVLPNTYKYIPDLKCFKVALKKWKLVNCLCRICKVYIANVGFV